MSFFAPASGFFKHVLEQTMNARSTPALNADCAITDIGLADWGRKEIKIAETEMPGITDCP